MCVSMGVSVGVASVIVKHPAIPPCAIDGCSRNPMMMMMMVMMMTMMMIQWMKTLDFATLGKLLIRTFRRAISCG